MYDMKQTVILKCNTYGRNGGEISCDPSPQTKGYEMEQGWVLEEWAFGVQGDEMSILFRDICTLNVLLTRLKGGLHICLM